MRDDFSEIANNEDGNTPDPRARVRGVGPDQPVVTNADGGKQSDTPYGFDLLDPDLLFGMARVMRTGAARYPRDNWRLIPAYEHLNHLLQHVFAFMSGDQQEDHLAHAGCRLMFLYATVMQSPHHRAKVEEVRAKVEEARAKSGGGSSDQVPASPVAPVAPARI